MHPVGSNSDPAKAPIATKKGYQPPFGSGGQKKPNWEHACTSPDGEERGGASSAPFLNGLVIVTRAQERKSPFKVERETGLRIQREKQLGRSSERKFWLSVVTVMNFEGMSALAFFALSCPNGSVEDGASVYVGTEEQGSALCSFDQWCRQASNLN